MSMLGRRHTPQAKAKMRLANLGRPRSAAQIASLVKAQETWRRQLRRMTKAQRREAFRTLGEVGTIALRKFWAAYRPKKAKASAGGVVPSKPNRKTRSGKKATERDGMSTVT
jgi:hypothetical protein